MVGIGRKVTSVDLILLVVKIFPFNNKKKYEYDKVLCSCSTKCVCETKKNVSRKYFCTKERKEEVTSCVEYVLVCCYFSLTINVVFHRHGKCF